MDIRLKVVSLVAVLLIGVILGLLTAERGIYKIEGLPEQQLQQPQKQSFYITKVDNGKMEVAVMGQKATATQEKKSNYMSRVGISLGQAVRGGTQAAVNWMSSFFQP
ncbi:DUF3679 domain-containing protein [Brevibacillus fluminis]|uniref:DUF3679 domain-containing protein n=1 Tax=Brevibacillus fluminis TaxID=511487 RepID=A0A3M8D2S2_9BACL|nr:DUF3679 domain-containing protein [Brevibacillus fluminis]RNB82322.1 DUF3679 domain-containing protein [Brevibacillus fluminis]